MLKVPCNYCIVFVMCKHRFRKLSFTQEPNVSEFAWVEQCKMLERYLYLADQNDINRARILYDLEPLP